VFFAVAHGTQLIIVKNCKECARHPSPKDGGFHLFTGEEVVLELPKDGQGEYGEDKVFVLTQQEKKVLSKVF